LIFQHQCDQTLALLQDQFPISGLSEPDFSFFIFQDFSGPVGKLVNAHDNNNKWPSASRTSHSSAGLAL